METLEKTVPPQDDAGADAFASFRMPHTMGGEMVPVQVQMSAIQMSNECYLQHLRLVEKQQEQDALKAEREYKLADKKLDYAHEEKMTAMGVQKLYTFLSFFGLLVIAGLIGFLAYLQTSERWITVAATLVGAFGAYITVKKAARKG